LNVGFKESLDKAHKSLVVDRAVSQQVALTNDSLEVISLLALPELLYLLFVRLPPERLLKLTLVLLIAGSWVSGSLIRECPRDKEVGLKELSDRAHTDIEFRRASISDNNVHVLHKWECGGMVFHLHLSAARWCLRFVIYDVGCDIL